MARARKSATPIMNDAANRLAGLKSIEAKLDFGNGVSVATFEAAIADAQAALEDYNSTLALADEKLNVFSAKEKVVQEMHKKALTAVEYKYGADSNEYEKAGGTRESERAKPGKKAKAPTS